MIRPLAIVLSLAMVGPLCAVPDTAPPASSGSHAPPSAFEFGPRPDRPVFDPTGTLPAATLTEIATGLDTIHTNDGIDIVVVLLKSLDGAPPGHVAGRFGRAWCSPLFHCVVLHVPGDPDGPWIVPGGILLRRFSADVVRAQVAAACHRASLEPSDDQKVRAAATEASDMLRIWVGDGVYLTAKHDARIGQLREQLKTRERLRTILPPAVSAILLLLAGAILGIRLWLRAHRPLLFPHPDWQRRLGAPYAGGNDASMRLARRASKPSPASVP